MNLIILSCILASIHLHAMDEIDLRNVEEAIKMSFNNGVQTGLNVGFDRGVRAAGVVLDARTQQANDRIQTLSNVVQSQQNMIITQQFRTQRLIIANNYNRQKQRSIRRDLLNSLQIQRGAITAQNETINTLTQQNNAAHRKIEKIQNIQWSTAGLVAMIALVDPMEKEYLQDTTNLSNEEIDDKMIGERLFALSALALCHPVSAAIIGTSAAVIKIKQYL